MIDIVRSYINDGIVLVQLAAVLIVCVVVLTTWSKTKSAMATFSAMVVGALVIAFLLNANWLGAKAAEDIQERDNGAGAPVAEVWS